MRDFDTGRGGFPQVRMRRMRRDAFARRLMREHHLTVDDLIYPIFVLEGNGQREAVTSMPGVERLCIDKLLKEAAELVELGIPAVALFPLTPPSCKRAGEGLAFGGHGTLTRRTCDDRT